eukprot:6172232-Pleurochrysis_carterae.AAC.1
MRDMGELQQRVECYSRTRAHVPAQGISANGVASNGPHDVMSRAWPTSMPTESDSALSDDGVDGVVAESAVGREGDMFTEREGALWSSALDKLDLDGLLASLEARHSSGGGGAEGPRQAWA